VTSLAAAAASFAKMFSAGKTRAIGLPYAAKPLLPGSINGPISEKFCVEEQFFSQSFGNGTDPRSTERVVYS